MNCNLLNSYLTKSGTLFCFLLIYNQSVAQNTMQIRYGLNRAIWRLDDRVLEDDTYTIDRNVVGLGVDVTLSKMFSICPEIMLVKKGNKFLQRDTITEYTFINKMTYVEIVVPFKFNLRYDQFTFYLSAGPHFARGTNGREYYEERTKNNFFIQINDINFSANVYNRSEFGLTLGTGLSIPIWKLRLGVDARYVYGISKVNKDGFQQDFNAYNKGIQLAGFIGIPFVWD